MAYGFRLMAYDSRLQAYGFRLRTLSSASASSASSAYRLVLERGLKA